MKVAGQWGYFGTGRLNMESQRETRGACFVCLHVHTISAGSLDFHCCQTLMCCRSYWYSLTLTVQREVWTELRCITLWSLIAQSVKLAVNRTDVGQSGRIFGPVLWNYRFFYIDFPVLRDRRKL